MAMIACIFTSIFVCLAYSATNSSSVPVVVSASKSYTSTDPVWVTSPYFKAGNVAVIKTKSTYDITLTYIFTFSSAFSGGIPNLAYGIKNYRGDDYLGQQKFEIKKSGLTQSTFTVQVKVIGWTRIWLLSVSYLAMDPTFPYHLNTFDDLPINSNGNIVNITNYQSGLTYYTSYNNYTKQAQGLSHTTFTTPLSQNYVVLFITSLWIEGTYYVFWDNPIQYHVSTGIVNQSYYYINATLQTQTIVTKSQFSQVVFNYIDVQSSNKFVIIYQTWISDRYGGFLTLPSAFLDNFIMGVTAFQAVDTGCGFQYQWEFTNQTVNGALTFGVKLLQSWTVTDTCGFSWSQSSIFYLKTWQCNSPYYYYNQTTNVCQTYCGAYYYENVSNYVCISCPNALCYQCNNANRNYCTDCAASLFYQLSNNSCVCMSAYFASQSACLPCANQNTGCLACSYNDGANGTLTYNSSLFQCTSCNNTANYFLSGKLCTLCSLSNCVSCQNLTICTTCASTYNLSVILTCVKCFVTGCTYCSATNSNQCAVCSNGYYLSNTSSCNTKCGDGIYVSAAQQCDDGNNVTYDGCSSACSIQTSFTCSGSPSICYFASNVTFSLVNTIIQTAVCDTITFTFKILPSSTTFSQPNIIWNNFITTANSSMLSLNTSMITYNSGNIAVSYTILASVQNQSLTFGTNFQSILQNGTIFANTHSNSLTFNVLPTNNKTANVSCCTGYYYNSAISSCSEICGDGILYVLACDDGNTASGDGCSPACQVQSSFACVNGSTTSPSICSFSGSISVSVSSATKDPSSNSLTLSYSITPIQPILNVINNSNNFAPYISLSNPAATITSAIYDPSSGLVNVVVSYNESIQGQALNLQFTPPNTTQGSLLPNIGNSWTVNPTNHLAASYYSKSTYDAMKKLTPYTTTCLAVYLALNGITLFFKKFVGLQLATLMQIGYLSLLTNSQLPIELQTVSSWPYVFGYNNFYPSRNLQAIQPYSLYGYQKNFGYACNFMVLAIVVVYGLSLLLMIVSAVTSRAVSRRLKEASLMLINQIGFALVIFSTPNIITAFCIEIKEGNIFNTSLFWSTSFLVLSIASIIVGNIINLANIQDGKDVGTFYRKHSLIGVYCSLFFSIRLICVTVFLFLYQTIGAASMYIILAIQFLYVLFIIIGRPHKKTIDFVRALTIETSLLYILTIRFVESSFLTSVDKSSHIFNIFSVLQLASYGFCILLSIASFIYHLIKKIKKNKIHPDEEKNQVIIDNESIAKMQFQKQFVPSISPTKRKLGEKSNEFIFDIEQMENSTNQPAFGSTNNSEIKMDVKRQQRKYRKRR